MGAVAPLRRLDASRTGRKMDGDPCQGGFRPSRQKKSKENMVRKKDRYDGSREAMVCRGEFWSGQDTAVLQEPTRQGLAVWGVAVPACKRVSTELGRWRVFCLRLCTLIRCHRGLG